MTIVHLVYIHGFQGNDTTFQSFPNDLQEYLSARIPQHLGQTIISSLYPTYKSVKPISFATKNFLEWLSTQPPGPVILLGHSMGGLLAADAATDASNTPEYPGRKPRRIIGMVAFDTPYLGMHPHVVVSGIASLFPKDKDQPKSEGEMNPSPDVKIVDEAVTDDWEAFKKNIKVPPKPGSTASGTTSLLSVISPSPLNSPQTTSAPNSPSFSPSSSTARRSPLPLVDSALSFFSAHEDDPLVRWIRKHSDDPLGAGKKWFIEHFQFGVCMFDPSGLKDRYSRLVNWQGGVWVNYWSQTIPRAKDAIKANSVNNNDRHEPEDVVADNDIALIENGILEAETPRISSLHLDTPESIIATAPTKSEMKAAQKEEKKIQTQLEKDRKKELKKLKKQRDAEAKSEKERNMPRPERHFIVLPNGIGEVFGGFEKWEKVTIGGVEDEVAAHCGLFIRGQNLDYDGFVERVGKRIIGWCENL